MPEGPEVRCRADTLVKTITGFIFVSIEQNGKGRYRNKCPVIPTPEKITRVTTHGKMTFLHTIAFAVKIHYMMEGRLQSVPGPHSDLWFNLVDPNGQPVRLYFDDTRHFGTIEVLSLDGRMACLAKLGFDPLAVRPEDQDIFRSKVAKRGKNEICRFLMDQSIVSGIGNYLKSEILFRAKMSPTRLVRDLMPDDLDNLFRIIISTAKESYAHGGCTIRTYSSPNGTNFSSQLKVYGQKVCDGHPVQRDTFSDGRTTHWVPTVQV